MSERKQQDISILYVEDEAATREEIVNLLKRRVEKVWVAGNGDQGLELFRQSGPDLVITDIRMPVLDGLSMAEKIKEFDRDCQIIVTTAHSDVSFMMRAIEIGVDQYVLKPIETVRLFAAIGKCAEIIALRRAEKLYREEREKLIAELQNALAGVKLLSGFLPICASCKKIRDSQGAWQQLEVYITNNSEAKFSHGICPDCTQRLYPEYFERIKGKPEVK